MRQVSRIYVVGLDGLDARAGSTAGRNNIAVNTIANQVTLQAIADVGCLVTQLDFTPFKMPGHPVQLAHQALQRGPALEIKDFTGIFIECRSVVLGIIDIQADVDYILFHRHLRFCIMV